jgi:hypothetical protein
MRLTQAEAAWGQSTGDSRELCRPGHGTVALCARAQRERKRGVKVSEEGEAEGEPGHRLVDSGAWGPRRRRWGIGSCMVATPTARAGL